ncbi:methyltransferase domain-containing protein [Streptantibioticus rubrisoli]|uniref:Trans-aconitate 2-methyltransferase n=1 Tax=Streptantibioticus rubrisoli TaxID=1387313 RepID=A0ABT1P528_9ACTN|nr:methyltransferase domain-containing protein [Streptantibioticus rubrisoli]MCQ4040465.1 methyltransferase domain-containing protein [Streptantibioticus rubrisoli]
MTAPNWDPQQYLRFAKERTRPLRELLARVPELPAAPVVLDLGCGPGNSTAVVREHWPQARITGVDNSPEMLHTARTTGEPSADYLLADAAEHDPAPARPDLIVSNALIQWLPGHIKLLPRWVRALRLGGVLAFQAPGNFDAPSHTLLSELIGSPRWSRKLDLAPNRSGVHEPAEYLDALLAQGCAADVWETTYYTVLTGPDPVLDWTRGTALRPVLSQLTDPADQAAFLTEYGALLREAYPAGPHGTVFPFRRLFAVAVRQG